VGGALMAMGETATRATLEDVARAAGVSLATVDRVVNRREGVREKTIARVEAAVAKLGYRADAAATRLARNQSFRFAFILPTGANSFMANLTEQVQRTAGWLAGQRGFIDVLHVDVFDPETLARALESIPSSYHGVATIALDHARVRAAIDDLAARGVAVVTLVSDAPSSRRIHYVGIDNPAAGRTAATLMGRFLHGGPVRSASSRDRSRCATMRSGNSASTRSSPASIRTS
jgi:LacI family transcriptional regulator